MKLPTLTKSRGATHHSLLRGARRYLSQICLLLLLVLGLPSLLEAAPQVVPSFPNTTQTPGQLLFLERNIGRTGNMSYHNGFIYTNNISNGSRREWTWSDSNDASSFYIARGPDDGLPPLAAAGNHTHYKSGEYLMGRIRRAGTWPTANTFESDPNEISAPGDDLYLPWGVPFVWLQYSTEATGEAYIYNGATEYASWPALAEDGVTGNHILLGNILIITSDESELGIVAYDITNSLNNPGEKPQLIDKLSGDLGAYIAIPWRHYIIMARRNPSYKVEIIDWQGLVDGSGDGLRFVGTIDTPNAGNVPYASTQDEFLFVNSRKINLETQEVVLEFDESDTNRPAGSVAGVLDTSAWMLPIGNLLVTGSYSGSTEGIGIWAHAADPDTEGPYVGYHVPRDGTTNYPVNAPISVLIHETLESYTIIDKETVIVREVGETDPANYVDCYLNLAYTGVLTITPNSPLEVDTTYEVVFPEDGIRDAANNGMQPYSFTFATGDGLSGGNGSPVIASVTSSATPVTPGENVTFTVNATDPENDTLEYRYSVNDGTADSGWVSSEQYTHTFNTSGHWELKVQVRDLKPSGATSLVTKITGVTVAPALTGPFPTKSSQIILDETNRTVWTVNPDNSSVAAIDADGALTGTEQEIDLVSLLGLSAGTHVDPRSIAMDSAGQLWIACRGADRVAVMSNTGSLLGNISTGHGSAPVGVAVSPDGNSIYVTLEGRGHDADGDPATGDPNNGQIIRYNTSMTEVARLELGPMPRAIAITGDGNRALVTRFIAEENYNEVWDLDTSGSGLALTRTIKLGRHEVKGDGGASNGAGVPNYVSSITISPDGQYAWYTAVKADTERGQFFDLGTGNNGDLIFEHTVRAMVGRIDLSQNEDIQGDRIDVDNSDSPTAVAFSERGDYGIVVLQGNNELAFFDTIAIRDGETKVTKWRLGTGSAPQGIVLDPTNNRAFVKNFMSRDVSALDLDPFLSRGERVDSGGEIPTVNSEELDPAVLAGKTIFYHASDEMGQDNYISCATCHVDGMHDGRNWDFTERGEGFRNTVDLRGRAGMAHGNVHWSANFDEIQDFILDIVNEFEGTGFLAEGEVANDPLGAPNAGRSTELDNLAAYVESLGGETLPKSPHRNSDGSMSTAAMNGAAHFESLNCVSCHSPETGYTDSSSIAINLHDVGTMRTSSGQRLGSTLLGIDSPTLLGIWNSAPYLHDGSAPTLEDVFVVAGGQTLQAEDATLNGAAVPNFIPINWNTSVHGELVEVESGDNITFSNVDGGSGGTGALELRYSGSLGTTIGISVNGTSHDYVIDEDGSNIEWRRARVEGITLTAGTSNTIVLEYVDGDFNVDDMTVSTADELSKAAAHRDALALTGTEFDELVAYLLELDGANHQGDTSPGLLFLATNRNPVFISEGNSGTQTVEIQVQRLGGASGPVTVDYSTSDDTAVAGSDYVASSGTLTWNDGDRLPKSFTVEINGDTDVEGSESFHVNISNAGGGATLGAPQTVEVLIVGDDVTTGQLTYGNGGRPGTGEAWFIDFVENTRIEAEDFDQGGQGVAYNDTGQGNTTAYRPGEGVDLALGSTDSLAFIDFMVGDEWLEYSIRVLKTTTYDLRFSAGTKATDNPEIKVVLDGTPLADDGTILGSVAVTDSDNFSPNAEYVLEDVTINEGVYRLRLEIDRPNPSTYRAMVLNWMQFEPADIAPTIVTDPQNITADAGANVIFVAAASGSPKPALQWQVSTNAGGTWSDVPGAITTSLVLNDVSTDLDGNQYRLVATNAAGTITSADATLTVNENTLGPAQYLVVNMEDGNVSHATVYEFTLQNTSGQELTLTGNVWAAAASDNAEIDVAYDTAGGTNFSNIWAQNVAVPRVVSGSRAAQTQVDLGSALVIPNGQTWSFQVTEVVDGLTSKWTPSNTASDANLTFTRTLGGNTAVFGQIEYKLGSGGTTFVAEDDTGNSVDEGSSVSIDVLANDIGATAITSFSNGSLGAVTENAGELVYTPNVGVWSGSDTFSYTATDGSNTDSADVSVTINATNGTSPLTDLADFSQVLLFGNAQGESRQRSDGTYEVSAFGGAGIDTDNSTGDEFMMVQKEVSGDFRVSVQVSDIQGPTGSFAGVMIRDGNDTASWPAREKMALEASEKGSLYLSQERVSAGNGAAVAVTSQISGVDVSHSEPEKWVMIERSGDTITYFTGEDDGQGGIAFTAVDAGPITLSGLSDTVQVGLFTISGDGTSNATAIFDNYLIEPLTSLFEINIKDGNITMPDPLEFEIQNVSGRDITLTGNVWMAAKSGGGVAEITYDTAGGTNFSNTWASNVSVPFVDAGGGRHDFTQVDLGAELTIPAGATYTFRIDTTSGSLGTRYNSSTASDGNLSVDMLGVSRVGFGQIEYY